MKTVSCIIPAYNEERRIASLLEALTPLLGTFLFEIVIIDDYSNDKTKKIIQNYPNIRIIEHHINTGKSASVADGLAQATGEYILMLDGDLVGLTPSNIKDLVLPIMKGLADISISHRGNTTKWWIKAFGIETLSGERCFAREFLVSQLADIRKLPGYGLEVFMNNLIIEQHMRIVSVPINNVTIEFKWQKFGYITGLQKEFIMWKQIFSVISFRKFVLQVIRMKRLLVTKV